MKLYRRHQLYKRILDFLTIAQRRVETDISQLSSSDVLFLGRDIGENDGRSRDPSMLEEAEHVGLALSREAKQPQDALRHATEDPRPRLEDAGTSFVQLIEVAEHHAVLLRGIQGMDEKRDLISCCYV